MISNDPEPTLDATMETHRALVVLRTLADPIANGRAHEHLLGDWLHTLALGCTRDRLRVTLRFLEQSGLITTTPLDDRILVQLTRAGGEVASGQVRVPGVLPFDVGCPY